MKGKYWHSMNLHAQMPYVHCTSIMNLASDPEDKKPKSRVLPLQITAERRSCDIDAEALQVWASATDPGGSCRQVWMDLGTGKANTSWLKGLQPMKCFEFSAIHEL